MATICSLEIKWEPVLSSLSEDKTSFELIELKMIIKQILRFANFSTFGEKKISKKRGGPPPKTPLKRGPPKNDPPMTAYDPQFVLQKWIDT